MNVSLTPHLEAMVRQRVESGRYNNASEVVRDALRLLEEHERVEHLRSLLAVGLEQSRRGEVVEFTPETGRGHPPESARSDSCVATNRSPMSVHRPAIRFTREAVDDIRNHLALHRSRLGRRPSDNYWAMIAADA